MLQIEAILPAALALTLGAASPGPSLAVVLRNTLEGGRVQGIACALGHGVGFGIYASAAVLGLVVLMRDMPRAFALLQLLGVVLLLYMAWDLLRASGNTAHTHNPSGRRGFAEGALIALFNPKIALFFLAVFSAVLHEDLNFTTQAVIAGLGWLIDTLWYLLVALLFSTQRAAAWIRRQGRRIDLIMAVLFVGLAVVTLARVS